MRRQRQLPEFARSTFRDQATDDRVERIWRRLAVDLAQPDKPSRVTPKLWLPLGAAAAGLIFVAGALVGQGLSRSDVAHTRVVAEPVAGPGHLDLAEPEPPVTAIRPTKPVARPRPSRLAAHNTPAPTASAVQEVLAPPVREQPPSAAVAATPSWQVLAGQLDYEAARQALENQGGFEAALSQASPEELMILHDVARATGNRAQALQALQNVVQRYPDDPNAPIAAWSLGNLLEASGDRAGASQAYSRYRSLSPQGDFAEDALARQAQVAIEQGDIAQARRLAAQYEQDFPNGRHIDELQAQMAQLLDAGANPHASGADETDSPSTDTEELAPKGW